MNQQIVKFTQSFSKLVAEFCFNTKELPPPACVQYGHIYVLRPNGNVCIVTDTEFSYVECYEVLILTGTERGVKKIVRKRDIVTSKCKKPSQEDILNYRIYEYNY